MNTRKVFFGLIATSILCLSSCTNGSEDIYEGVDRTRITKPQAVDRTKITKPKSVDRTKITKPQAVDRTKITKPKSSS